jgi:hypothetical protein
MALRGFIGVGSGRIQNDAILSRVGESRFFEAPGSESHLSIELLFFKNELLGTWFKKKATSGGGELIEFTGDKVEFAKAFVPHLAKENFEHFRPLFEFVESRCKATVD